MLRKAIEEANLMRTLHLQVHCLCQRTSYLKLSSCQVYTQVTSCHVHSQQKWQHGMKCFFECRQCWNTGAMRRTQRLPVQKANVRCVWVYIPMAYFQYASHSNTGIYRHIDGMSTRLHWICSQSKAPFCTNMEY